MPPISNLTGVAGRIAVTSRHRHGSPDQARLFVDLTALASLFISTATASRAPAYHYGIGSVASETIPASRFRRRIDREGIARLNVFVERDLTATPIAPRDCGRPL
jgi:hypothetical protein